MSMTPIDTWKAERELLDVEEAMGTVSASLRQRLKETGRGMSRDELVQIADWLERQHTKLLQARTALGITGRRPESNPLHQELARLLPKGLDSNALARFRVVVSPQHCWKIACEVNTIRAYIAIIAIVVLVINMLYQYGQSITR